MCGSITGMPVIGIGINMIENKGQNNNIFRILDDSILEDCEEDNRKRVYMTPRKILWESQGDNCPVKNSSALLENRSPQISLVPANPCILKNKGEIAGILLDFGVEIHGGISLLVWKASLPQGMRVRVRFGESAMEAMSEIGGETNATNDHANRDMIVEVRDMSMNRIGETGFRFVRIDLLDEGELEIKTVKSILIYKDIPYKGSFTCSDPMLNRIWDTGAYTVHLNMQNYIWDGIKRDRLVWVGDMHPEVTTIQSVFGYDESVPRSLDFVREETPLPGWMNGFPAYSMWWIIIQHDWFIHTGDLAYLKTQREYLKGLYRQLSKGIDENGKDNTPEVRFVDWPSFQNQPVVDAGLQALHAMATQKLQEIFTVLEEEELVRQCEEDLKKLASFDADYKDAKQAAALLVMAGLKDPVTVNDQLLKVGGAKGMSTFMGYYILTARAMAGDIKGCLECIREYWGGMLSLGATTFWEDFNVDWLENAAPIDQITEAGEEVNVHGTYGGHCYVGYRHSLCHGWASGVTPWLMENVLGIQILEPGCKKAAVKPDLGDLSWASGKYPTPYGEIQVTCIKRPDGSIDVQVEAPEEIEIVQ